MVKFSSFVSYCWLTKCSTGNLVVFYACYTGSVLLVTKSAQVLLLIVNKPVCTGTDVAS